MRKTGFFSTLCSLWHLLLVSVLLLGITVSASAELPPEEEGVCARVRIRLSQKVTIARTAFRATLEISNAPENVPLENLEVTLDIQDMAHDAAGDKFGIREPELTGISDVTGTGTILPGTSAKAEWTLIPTRDAAPEQSTPYYVGGTMRYTESGEQVTIPLFPASITVLPDPKLILNYFLVRDVYSDDPFTEDIIEPAEPFPLGLLLSNQGRGTANRVRIQSSPPEIIENEKGLLIDFEIIGTRVNDEDVTPSLNVDLGSVGPDETAVAQWMMTSSLQGKFSKYEARFEHLDALANARTSLIDSVNIHELLHVVRADLPDDDEKPDFLVNDTEDEDFMPDTLYNSDGSVAVVNVVSDSAVAGQLSNSNLQITLNGTSPGGWFYIRIDDPGEEKFQLKKVIRSDGREIRMDENVWTTHRTIRLKDQEPYRENRLHLFDFAEAGEALEYTLIYEDLPAQPEAPVLQSVQNRSVPEGQHFGFIVKASDPNGSAPVLSATPLPEGAVFTDAGNGEGYFEWATTLGQADEYKITFSASDGQLSDSQEVTLVVYADDDLCPDDPAKTEPGICGCGVPDTDHNGNGVIDCLENNGSPDPPPTPYDQCPNDPNKTEPGICGCGTPDTDSDNDGTADCKDQCPDDPAKTEPGVCGCGVSDADSDSDGTADCNDECKDDPNKTEPGICGCGVSDVDSDGNGIMDCQEDNTEDLCPDDPNKTEPGLCGCGVADTDRDADGTPDCNDNCPDDPAKTEPGICGCGISDEDSNGDGTPDCQENHPPNQPVLISPDNESVNVSLTPALKTDLFEDPDTGSIHSATRWQVGTDAMFAQDSLIIDEISEEYLTDFTVPELLLNDNTPYYWRALFRDHFGAESEWAEPFSFTTGIFSNDTNGNGIPDDQEISGNTDLNGDGTPDSAQEQLRCLISGSDDIPLCIELLTENGAVTSIKAVDPNEIEDSSGKPDEFPTGIVTFRLEMSDAGTTAEVMVYFSEIDGVKQWYGYDTRNGWRNYADHAEFAGDGKSVKLTLEDGGFGDIDGIANSIIVSQGGISSTHPDCIISGRIVDAAGNGVSGVEITGLPEGCYTDEDGYYTANVPYAWSGNIVPQKEGYVFSPEDIMYESLVSDREKQDFTAEVSVDSDGGGGGSCFINMISK